MKLGKMMDNLHHKSFSTAESGCPFLEQTVTLRIVPINLNSSSCDRGQSCGIRIPTNRETVHDKRAPPSLRVAFESRAFVCVLLALLSFIFG